MCVCVVCHPALRKPESCFSRKEPSSGSLWVSFSSLASLLPSTNNTNFTSLHLGTHFGDILCDQNPEIHALPGHLIEASYSVDSSAQDRCTCHTSALTPTSLFLFKVQRHRTRHSLELCVMARIKYTGPSQIVQMQRVSTPHVVGANVPKSAQKERQGQTEANQQILTIQQSQAFKQQQSLEMVQIMLHVSVSP